MEEIQYYKINEALNHKYCQIPQELFVNGKYKDKLNSDSKILYSFLLDRLTLSQLNNWVDEFGRIYLIFTRQEVQEKSNISEKTACKAFKQLIDVKLIDEKRQSLGKPNLIYVGKIIHEEIKAIPEQENLQLLTRKNYGSGTVKNTVPEQEILHTINTNNINTNIIKTDSINLESDEENSLNEIKEKCKLNEFAKEDKLVLEDVIDGLYYKDGNDIEKICGRDFWKGRDSYKKLQNKYWEYVTSKGFELQRGFPVEETNRKHISIQEYKKITNFKITKKVLEDIKLELSEVPQLKDFKKLMMNRDEKIVEKIIKPKDKLIEKLHQDNVRLHKELTKQAKIVNIAEEYQQEKTDLLQENKQLKYRCNTLQRDFEIRERALRREFKNKVYENSQEYIKYIDYLENENNKLRKIIDRFKLTISKFITWVCNKFSVSSEDTIIRDFEKETYISFNVEKQINDMEKRTR